MHLKRAATEFVVACGMAAAIACSSTKTSLVGPTGDSKCQITVGNAPDAFSAGGGTGTVTVSAARECTWSIATSAEWVSVNGDRSGQGDATIRYTVAPNPVPSPRTGSIAVGSRSISISQAAAPCRYTLSRTQDAIAAGGGRLAVDVATTAGCAWTAASNAPWIGIAGGQNGNGSGTVGLEVSANTGAQRVGQMNIAGQTYTVVQAAAAASPTPAPPSPAPTPAPTPTPPPAPSPSPSPSPAPPPSGGETVQFSGIVLAASGKCPDLTLNVSGRVVITDKSTKFKDVSCGDVAKTGRTVFVTGVTDSSGAVHATQITKVKDNDVVAASLLH
jgi:hypothetical protein